MPFTLTADVIKSKMLGDSVSAVPDTNEYTAELKHARITVQSAGFADDAGKVHEINTILTKDEFIQICINCAGLTDPQEIADTFMEAVLTKTGYLE